VFRQLTGIIQDQVDNQPNLQQTFEVSNNNYVTSGVADVKLISFTKDCFLALEVAMTVVSIPRVVNGLT